MQLTYNVNPAVGVVGALAETGPHVIETKIAGGTIRPGQYVVFDGEECNHPSSAPTPATRGGIALRNPYKQDDGVYAEGDVVSVLREGKVWVESEDAVEADDPARVRVVAAGDEELGALSSEADSTDNPLVPGLYFRSAGTSLVKLEVNFSAYVAP